MKILVIGKFYTEGFGLHIAETLVSSGHQVRTLDPGLSVGGIPGKFGRRVDQLRSVIYGATDNLVSIRRKRFSRLLKQIKKHPCDLAICCFDFLQPEEVEQIKQHVSSVVMWFPDHLANFAKGYFMNAPYDAIFFKDPHIVRVLSEVIQSPVYYLPECFNTKKHTLPWDTPIPPEYECELTTAGNQHSYRAAFLKHLTEFDMKLWGNPAPLWMRAEQLTKMYQGRPVFNHEKVLAFRGAKIVVNNLYFGEIEGVNVRTFEAAGAGGFQFVDWRPGLAQLFEDGKELVSFRSIAELKTLIRHYLLHPDQRNAIAIAGNERAMREHTYEHRLTLMLDTINGTRAGFPLPENSQFRLSTK